MSRCKHRTALISAFLATTSWPALAQDAGGETALPEITVQAQGTGNGAGARNDGPVQAAGGTGGAGSLTVPSVEKERERINQIAGSVEIVDAEQFKNRFTNTLRDVLKDVPGAYVQERYGQELRVSIRGSGIARGYHLRGIELLQDGIPFNFADGSGDFYQIDPLAARAVEVYKGGNALLFGASTLGGAVNFVTPTAYTAIAPNILRLESGSFGTLRENFQFSRISGPFDFLINGTFTNAAGFRDHSTQRTQNFNGNFGYKIAPGVETRFYVGGYLTDQKLPGALSLSDALFNPRLANPSAITGNQSRQVEAERVANRTSFAFDVGQLDIDSWAFHKKLYHPIFQVLDQDGWTYGIAPRYTATLDLGGYRDDVVLGARYFAGQNTALQFINIGGNRGAQTLNSRQNATNLEGYAENRFFVLPTLALMTGVKLLHDGREYSDKGGLPADRTPKFDDRVYQGVNPKVGLLWTPQPFAQVFVDLTRSRDIPDFTDLTQTTAATTRFTPLAAQRAWTAEVGTRGRADRFTWDVTLFRSVVRDELLQFTANSNIPASTFNAPRTLHQGLEAGIGFELVRDVSGPGAGDKLTVAGIWNHSDFHFDRDPQYGSNAIAGLPGDVLRSTLTYSRPDGIFVAPAVDWIPVGAFADYANTLRAPGYVLFGVQAGLNHASGFSFFVEGRNLTNRHFISDLSTITDARKVSTAIFYPGNGRSVYAGVRYAF